MKHTFRHDPEAPHAVLSGTSFALPIDWMNEVNTSENSKETPGCDEAKRKESGWIEPPDLTRACAVSGKQTVVFGFWDFGFMCSLLLVILHDHYMTYCPALQYRGKHSFGKKYRALGLYAKRDSGFLHL